VRELVSDFFELGDSHVLDDVGFVDVSGAQFIAHLADFLLSSDNFVFNQKDTEAEFAKGLRVVVSRNTDHTEVRSFTFL
jgi:hypothetical protein